MVLRGLLLLSIDRFDDSCVSYVRIALVRSIVFSDRGIQMFRLDLLARFVRHTNGKSFDACWFFYGRSIEIRIGNRKGELNKGELNRRCWSTCIVMIHIDIGDGVRVWVVFCMLLL